jgi:PAS domain S-box-containing protein
MAQSGFLKAFRSSPVAMAITTLAEGRYLDVNDAFQAMAGYARDDVLGRTSIELGWWADAADRARAISQLQAHGILRDLGIRFVTKSGERRVALLSAETIEVEGTPCVLSWIQDITERTRLSARETAARRQMEALTEIELELVAELSPDRLFRLIVERAKRLFQAECGILLATEGQLRPRMDTDPEARAVAIGEGLAGRCAQTRHGALVNDYPGWPDAIPWAVAHGLRHVMVQPLLIREQVLGVMSVSRRGPDAAPFHEEDLAALQRFAALASLAIENARLYREAEQRRREAEVLTDLAGDLNRSLDLDTVLRRVVEGARELCGSDLGGIALRERGSEDVRFRYAPGAQQDWSGVRIEPGRGAGGLVLLSGQPFKTDAYLTDPRISPEYAAACAAEGIVAQAVVPIRRDGRIEGLLYVNNRSARPFTDRDVQVLLRLADHAAIAIHNAQSFSERERAEAALRESERRYRLLAENIADVVTVFDMDLRQIYVSPSVMRLRGYSPEEAMQQTLPERLTPASVDAALNVFREELAREAAGGGDPSRFRTLELEMLRRDGSTVWVETTVAFLRNEDGQPVGIIGVTRDITERKQADAILRESEARFLQAQKMEAVGRLAGGIAHDFNNLLMVIGGWTELLLRTAALAAPVRNNLELIANAVDRASTLTRQLLAFSRKQVLQPVELDLDLVVDGLGQMLRRLIGEDIDLQLSECPGLGRVYADPSQIEQVLLNLAINARDAMPRGGRLTIRTANVERAEAGAHAHPDVRPGSSVMLSVSDTGVGMDPATRARIFEPFFTTKEVGKGTGLGLSTVYGIVQQSGGHIEVESEPGRGTTFRIYLPRIEQTAEMPAPATGPASVPPGLETIMLVEDERDLRTLLYRTLTMQGYRVLVARGGQEAIEVARRYGGGIDLLITDVVMPGARGDELARAMLESGLVRAVLYMSGYPDAATLPGAAFLQKPFATGDLARKAREILDATPRLSP